ncbi:hypothetical protein ABW21_db0208224 [Orbilia brochopaga]|nr:hypothetical protein ABW21_db0208224 [Drechslerella brochopaga]
MADLMHIHSPLNPLPPTFWPPPGDKYTPECLYDCLPLVLSARYCDLMFPADENHPQTEYAYCLCDNPYMQPLTTGLQCGFLCGHDSRAAVINFIKSNYSCGHFEPWNRISIPGPEAFIPSWWSRRERAWDWVKSVGVWIFFITMLVLTIIYFSAYWYAEHIYWFVRGAWGALVQMWRRKFG